jgi:flagellar motor switch protein FliG
MNIERLKAWLEAGIADTRASYEKAVQAEQESDYSDIMQSMDRKYEEGFLDALESVMRELEGN